MRKACQERELNRGKKLDEREQVRLCSRDAEKEGVYYFYLLRILSLALLLLSH